MADFRTAYRATSIVEGLYSDDPSDLGGETFMGISRKRWHGWAGWEQVDAWKRSNDFMVRVPVELLRAVEKFYHDHFWVQIRGSQITDQDIASEVFDTSVNMGWKTASRFLQRGLNLLNRRGKDYQDIKVDGRIGPQTLAALDDYLQRRSNEGLLKLLNHFQAQRYVELAEKHPGHEKYMHGWLIRV